MELIRSILDLDSRVRVMGVLNVTPDSFSDGGVYLDPESAIDRALEMEEEGADVIDIGGESTRPGSDQVDAATELGRAMPVIEKLASKLHVPLSIDTTKPAVASAAIAAGAEIINDISGLRFEPALAEVAAASGAGLILMHSRATPAVMQKIPPVDDVFDEVISGLRVAVSQARECGVALDKMIVDPGIGFGKTPRQNLQLIRGLDTIGRALELPVMFGPSRKSFVRLVLDKRMPSIRRDEEGERFAGTAAAVAMGVLHGARMVRVHDVAAMVGVVRLIEESLDSAN
jgi:dihydropteroate synthase